MRKRWHTLRDGNSVTVARHLPVRFDVCAKTVLPPCNPHRLARQIRQDLWRNLQRVSGFSPVVQVTSGNGTLDVIAGGRVPYVARAGLATRIADLLDDPVLRARWLTWARL